MSEKRKRERKKIKSKQVEFCKFKLFCSLGCSEGSTKREKEREKTGYKDRKRIRQLWQSERELESKRERETSKAFISVATWRKKEIEPVCECEREAVSE